LYLVLGGPGVFFMTAYILRRLILGLIVLVMATILIFLIMRLLPGDPLLLYLGQNDMGSYTEDQLVELRHQYGLDKSLVMQYTDWVNGIIHGNFGTSIFYKEDVGLLITERLPVTMHLGVLSFVTGAFFGILFGLICALRRGKWPDTVFTILSNIGITVPAFWVGILLVYLLSLKLGWLPTYGYTSPFTDFWLGTQQLIMPVFCLSLFSIASLTRQTRSSTLEVVRQDYIRTAWAKGLRERVIVIRHIIKNALIPVVTVMGMQVSLIFGGAVLIETVFNIPGMGRLMRDAVFGHDYQVVQAGVFIIAIVIVLTNIVVDISYGWFDPRIRYN
jgi:peptide/nickel transport system permease protein